MKIQQIKYCLVGLLLPLAMLGCNETGPSGTNNPISNPSNPSSPSQNGGAREWTYLVYMGADNSLSEFGLQDLMEMESVGSSDDVAIVVQAEFSDLNSQNVKAETYRVLVEKDNDDNSVNLDKAESIGNVNMADSETMSDFIAWGAKTYPAKNYAFVIWDHGAGWKSSQFLKTLVRGAVEDATSQDFLSLPELAKGVRDSDVHVAVLDFDACNMGMYEVGYEFKDVVDYMVAAEETVPGQGNPYDTLLAGLVNKPEQSAEEFAVANVEDFIKFYSAGDEAVTKSVIDLKEIDALHDSIKALGEVLLNESQAGATIALAQKNTQEFYLVTSHDLYDLAVYFEKNLTSKAVSDATKALKAQLANTVVFNETLGDSVKNSHGLAIYLPSASEVSATDLAQYGELAINQDSKAMASGSWGAFIEAYLGSTNEPVDGPVAQLAAGGFGAYLTWEGCEADLDLYVSEPGYNGADSTLYGSFSDTTTPNGTFSPESSTSGKDEEYYLANDQVTSGEYTVLVNLYGLAQGCDGITAHLFIVDPANGIEEFIEISAANGFNLDYPSAHGLSFENPLGDNEVEVLSDANQYSDWWVPVSTMRGDDGALFEVPSDQEIVKSKRTDAIFHNGKDNRI